jgi:hypothetical protein
MRSKPNTETLMKRANRRIMPKPCQPHKDANKYSRKQKHKDRGE